jgi:hypothetical protein
MLSVVVRSVIMLNVVAPQRRTNGRKESESLWNIYEKEFAVTKRVLLAPVILIELSASMTFFKKLIKYRTAFCAAAADINYDLLACIINI